MKTLFKLWVGLCLTACVSFARAELSPIPFVVGEQHFAAGDSIVIDQVLASSPQLAVGTQVTVRGHYRLASASRARLALYVTHRSPAAAADTPTKSQVQQVGSANGSFELSCEIAYEGDPHVSFYPAAGGKSFGGVYFSSAAPK